MGKEAAVAFREYLRTHPEVEEQARDIIRTAGSVDSVAFAKSHGFEFTVEEAADAWEEVSADGELSDFELEMVAGGGRYPCNTDDSRFAGDAYARAIDNGANSTPD